ncbi:homocysteine S-methyltransferase family protein [Kiloniella laminariae]|uniref:Homocysteine S-methyltransferase family protein n=1 Tax=Kiloniella laminariae TaxID=454162 RepID=A0ABT4LII5_9PROT|nr:homocysteine S-methyltransferase family protein [Kiloniella laminariae]MCZ4280929.1 homocysteine S-methyltransferase family protein [Kiloniella laminariae]
MRTFIDALNSRVLLTDGDIKPALNKLDLDMQRFGFGHEDCDVALNITRPDVIAAIHRDYLEAGADVIRTHTRNASPDVLEKYGMQDEVFIINHLAAETACQAVDALPGGNRRRFVLGVVDQSASVGDNPVLRNDAYRQVQGLVSGGVDAVSFKTLPNLEQARSQLASARHALLELGASVPLLLEYSEDLEFTDDTVADLTDGVYFVESSETIKAGYPVPQTGQKILVHGGKTPADTAVIDRKLRSSAGDGFRPATRPNVSPLEKVIPVSSWIDYSSVKAV